MVIGLEDRDVTATCASLPLHPTSLTLGVLDGTYPSGTGYPWLKLRGLRGRLPLLSARVVAAMQSRVFACGKAAVVFRDGFIFPVGGSSRTFVNGRVAHEIMKNGDWTTESTSNFYIGAACGNVHACQSYAHVSELSLSPRVGEMIAERFRNV